MQPRVRIEGRGWRCLVGVATPAAPTEQRSRDCHRSYIDGEAVPGSRLAPLLQSGRDLPALRSLEASSASRHSHGGPTKQMIHGGPGCRPLASTRATKREVVSWSRLASLLQSTAVAACAAPTRAQVDAGLVSPAYDSQPSLRCQPGLR